MNPCDKITDEQRIAAACGDNTPEVENHLARCLACRAAVEQARQVRSLAGSLAQFEPPPSLVLELRSRAAVAARKNRQPARRFRLLIPASAMAALLLLAVGLYLRGPSPGPIAAGTDETASAAWAQPLQLDQIETDLNRSLDQVGLEEEYPAEPAEPGYEAPAGESPPAPSAPEWEDMRSAGEKIDQLELALVALENDLGLETGN